MIFVVCNFCLGDLRIWDVRKGSCPIQYITAHLARYIFQFSFLWSKKFFYLCVCIFFKDSWDKLESQTRNALDYW